LSSPTTSSARTRTRTSTQLAFAEHEKAIRAVRADQILVPRLDVSRAASVLLAALPRIEAALPALAEAAGPSGPLVLELPSRTLALVHAEALHAISPPSSTATALLPEARHLRGHLLRHARLHAAPRPLPGPIPASVLAALGRPRGARNVGMSLLELAALYRRHWDDLVGTTVVTLAEIDQAQALGTQILAAGGERRRLQRASPEARLLRAKAFTYFRWAYDPARKAGIYVYGRAGAEGVLPNIFDWRGVGGRRGERGGGVEGAGERGGDGDGG
jgi:hypothetical protein